MLPSEMKGVVPAIRRTRVHSSGSQMFSRQR